MLCLRSFNQTAIMKLLEIESSILPWVCGTGKWMSVFVAERFKQSNSSLTIEQWLVLKLLHREDGLMQNEIAEITNRSKTSLTRLIHTMEKHYLVARMPDKIDKRVNRIFLTKNGMNVFEAALPIIAEVRKDLESGLTDREIKLLINALKKVQENIETIKSSCTTN